MAAKAPRQPQGHGRVAFLPGLRVTLKAARYGVVRTVGDHLQRARLMRGLLQKEVAEALGVSPYTVLHWEASETQPGPRDGPKIVAWLGYLPMPTETLPEQLYAIRFVNGWTQRQLAQALGVGEDAAREVEGGRRLSPWTMRRVEDRAAAILMEATVIGRKGEMER